MKRKTCIMIAAALLLTVLSGCLGTPGEKPDPSPGQAQEVLAQGGKLTVYTSFYPLYDFAKKVGADQITLENMVPAGTEPHDWEPSPQDIAKLEKADLFIYSGAGMEHWVDKVLGSLENDKLIVLEASKGLSLIESSAQEPHEDGEAGQDAHAYDPHVWLSIRLARQQMENIKNALMSADPAHASYFEENYSACAAQFDALDKEFTDSLSAYAGRDIIVAHQAFGYLCADYGLNQVAIEGLSPDSEPDPARMADIIAFAGEHSIKVIFFEELVSPKVAQTIADAIGAKTDVLNPLEGLTDEQLSAGGDYLSVMRENLRALMGALK